MNYEELGTKYAHRRGFRAGHAGNFLTECIIRDADSNAAAWIYRYGKSKSSPVRLVLHTRPEVNHPLAKDGTLMTFEEVDQILPVLSGRIEDLMLERTGNPWSRYHNIKSAGAVACEVLAQLLEEVRGEGIRDLAMKPEKRGFFRRLPKEPKLTHRETTRGWHTLCARTIEIGRGRDLEYRYFMAALQASRISKTLKTWRVRDGKRKTAVAIYMDILKEDGNIRLSIHSHSHANVPTAGPMRNFFTTTYNTGRIMDAIEQKLEYRLHRKGIRTGQAIRIQREAELIAAECLDEIARSHPPGQQELEERMSRLELSEPGEHRGR